MESRLLYGPVQDGIIRSGLVLQVPAHRLFVTAACLFAAAYLFLSLRLSAIFKKKGIPAWKAYVPFLNAWEAFVLIGKRGWCCLLLLIPLVQYAALLLLCLRLGELSRKAS